MEEKLEPQSVLSPEEAGNILKRWATEEQLLSITTAFPALEISGTVSVGRMEEEWVELGTKDGGAFFSFRLNNRALRLYGSSDLLVLDVAGDLAARLILTPAGPSSLESPSVPS